MRNGRLRHKLVYQEPTSTRDALGGKRETWTTVGTYRGELRSITARERLVNDQIRSETTHVVRHKTLPVPIRPTGRYVHAVRGVDHVYNVIGVIDVGNRGREYEVEVREAPSS